MARRVPRALALIVFGSLATSYSVLGCSDESTSGEATAGGTTSTGGSGGSGGASGGATSAGGGPAAAGGTTTSGGTASSSGGASGGTTSAGGAATSGGTATTGGTTAGTGGSPSGGAGGAGQGGSGGSGGGSRSPGCGTTDPLTTGSATIDVAGTEREYVLDVPEDYDPNTAYKLIFGWHWRGGQASDVVNGQIIGGPYYGLKSRANGTAIFVAPNGIDNGWANTGGRDIAFLQEMLDLFNSKLCIDQERIFSTGFSYGGMMSNAIGCAMPDVFRAIAPMSGALYSGCNDATSAPIAVWMAHGVNDDVVPVADGEAALEVFLEKNGCTSTTTPTSPSPCVSYQGCTAGYPVTYCKFDGGHSPQNWSSAAIWDFFNQF